MISDRIPELKKLTWQEKMTLADELLEELANDPSAAQAREDHVRLLEERLEHHRKNPDDVIPWEEVKARLLRDRPEDNR